MVMFLHQGEKNPNKGEEPKARRLTEQTGGQPPSPVQWEADCKPSAAGKMKSAKPHSIDGGDCKLFGTFICDKNFRRTGKVKINTLNHLCSSRSALSGISLTQ